MKSVYLNSTSLRAANCLTSQESAAVGVEYLFMGGGSRDFGQFTQSNHDFWYANIAVLNAAPKRNKKSGRYKQQYAVPI